MFERWGGNKKYHFEYVKYIDILGNSTANVKWTYHAGTQKTYLPGYKDCGVLKSIRQICIDCLLCMCKTFF